MNEQKIIPRKIWWGLEAKSYTEIAQQLPSRDGQLRTWVAIYAVYLLDFENRYPGVRYFKFLEDAKNSNYVAIEFSIPIHILETRDSVDASDATIKYCQHLETEEQINRFLQDKHLDPELFTAPWNCDYPLD